MAICFKRRARYLISASLILTIPLLLSVSQLHNQQISNTKPNPSKKPDHLVLGPAAGQGLPDRLQCRGTRAMNKVEPSGSQRGFGAGDDVSFVTVFAVYGSRGADDDDGDRVTVGNVSFSKLERSMAVLRAFVDFIQNSAGVNAKKQRDHID